MEYNLLTQEERDAVLVSALKSNQRDHFIHSTNLVQYQKVCDKLPVACSMREKLEKEIPVIESRLVEVEAIIEALEEQLPSQERVGAALQYLNEQ